MKDDSITRIDEITLSPGCRPQFHERLLCEYVPLAVPLGLELVEVSLAPPIDTPDREADMVVTWRLAGVGTFWRARAGTMTNPAFAKFWASTANLWTRRTRRYARPGSEPLALLDQPDQELPSGAIHSIVLLKTISDGPGTAPAPDVADHAWFGRHLAGSLGDSDASWEFDADRAVSAEDLKIEESEIADIVVVNDVRGGAIRASGLAHGIKRTLLLQIEPETPSDLVASFEEDLLAMPRYIGAIKNWRLSRVTSTGHGWTHAWEQEYSDIDGLERDYMQHPFHWSVVDPWFDPEGPRCIVEPGFQHLFYELQTSVLSPL